jgi:glutamine synthetase
VVTLDELRRLVHDGEVDTVVVAFTDMQGRRMERRLFDAVVTCYERQRLFERI